MTACRLGFHIVLVFRATAFQYRAICLCASLQIRMNRLAGAAVIACAVAQPSCNQVDGDYPGCDISKMTHASSQPKAGKTWMYKYFNVQTPGDECSNDECDCSSTGAPTIEQGRVFTTRQISPSGGMAPGNGFGLLMVRSLCRWSSEFLTPSSVIKTAPCQVKLWPTPLLITL